MARFSTPKLLGASYVTPIEIKNNQPKFTTESVSLRRQIVSTGSQRWELKINFQGGRTDNIFAKFQAHYIKQSVSNNNAAFFIAMPQNANLVVTDEFSVSSSQTVQVQSQSAGDDTVAMKVNNGSNAKIPAGWFIKFSNHNKIYMVTDSVELNNSSFTTTSISPALTQAVTSSDTVIVQPATDENDSSGVRISVLHEETNASVTYSAGIFQEITWSFVESL